MRKSIYSYKNRKVKDNEKIANRADGTCYDYLAGRM